MSTGVAKTTIKTFFEKDTVQDKFNEILGEKAKGFISSVIQVTSQSKYLSKADPLSVYSSAMMAATLDLPINQNLGFAWIIPFNESYKDDNNNWKKRQVAQFQMGWRGFVQLAQRTGQYESINVIEVYENQFKSFNYLTEEIDADFSIVGSGPIVGYCCYFKLLNGFKKMCYWTKDEVKQHGLKYSKSFNNGPWKDHFDAMAKKTVLKNTLSKWGILSIEMQRAQIADQSVIKDAETMDVNYPDNETEDQIAKEIPDEKLFKQIVAGIESETFTIEQALDTYELTDEEIEKLEVVKPKSK